MRDDGFLRREFEASLSHEGFHQRLDLLFEQRLRVSCDEKVISISHHIHFGMALLMGLRKFLPQHLLQAIEGEVGKYW